MHRLKRSLVKLLIVAAIGLVCFSTQPLKAATPLLKAAPLGGGLGKIALAIDLKGKGGIYILDLTSFNISPLLNIETRDLTWSPDGKYMAYDISLNRNLSIYRTDANGTHVYPLADKGILPTWSPDSKYIAFISQQEPQPYLYVMNADGTNQHRLANIPTNLRPSWSPDSKSVAFVSEGQFEAYTVNIVNSALSRLVHIGLDPAWSPDGKSIALSIHDGSAGTWHVSIIGSTDAYEHNVSSDFAGDVGSSAWSPDGKYLVVTAGVLHEGNWMPEAYVMDHNGSDVRQLTEFPETAEGSIQWSPDGNYVAFDTVCDKTPGIEIVGVEDHTKKCNPIEGSMGYSTFSWSP